MMTLPDPPTEYVLCFLFNKEARYMTTIQREEKNPDQTMFKQMNNDGKGILLLASEEGQSLIKMTANRQH